MGVIPDRIGEYEDRFFATVFPGSGLLFLAMIFTEAAEVVGIITVLGRERAALIQSGIYYLGRADVYQTMNHQCPKRGLVLLQNADYLRAAESALLHRWILLSRSPPSG
jgi:hypothetical protein